ncbi:NAD(P)-dependent oxidoreductase [Candidatus Ventrimonas sp. KK005]
MQKTDQLFYEDIHGVSLADFIPWKQLKNKTLFITGATGLIGSSLIKALLYASDIKSLDLKIIALVRNEKRAMERFKEEWKKEGSLQFIVGTVEKMPEISDSIDYIIHGASQTASKEFVEHAVETIETAICGTKNVLELAKSKQIQGLVYLSSMEVYGFPSKGHKVTEEEIGAMSPLDIRNSYPISKQMCEALSCAYVKEYSIPAMIIRLTQTFGPGINYNDTRVFAYFIRCAYEKKDIVLKTKGETERSYLYTTDAVTAILTVLLKGKPGQAYNAADENTYCSIAEMATNVAEGAGIKVCFQLEDEESNGFPKTIYMDLDTTRLKKLGWKPFGGGYTINEMYKKTLGWIKKTIM